ncbi:MAG: EamA family transporter [Actinobacteria bacterium]|nr:EamA family transporter [Actinomycetota bacterium]
MSRRAKVWGALWVVYIIWGSTYLFIAITVETIPPLLAVSTRFICAGTIMALVVRARGGSLRVKRHELASCVVIGCLLPGANAVLFYAEENVPTGLASLLIASVPLWVVVLRLLGRERLPVPALAGVGVGFVGVALLLQPSGGATATGVALCIASALMWSVGSVLSARLPMPANSFAATMYEMLAGGFVMLPLGIADAGSFSPSAGSILAWAYLVTIGSVVGYTAYTWLLANAPLGTVSTYAYVNPVVAIVLGILFRNEHLSVRIFIGAAIVVAAVAAVVRQEPPAATQPEEGVR